MVTVIVLSSLSFSAFAANNVTGCVTVSDTVEPNSGKDVSDEIQKIIDDNPNRTIYFPDGEYLLGEPIFTPADPKKSVSLELSDFAVLKATGDWASGEAVVQLGGKDPANDTSTNGSNY